MELINNKDLKKIIADCKKKVKAYKGKKGNTFMCSGNASDIIASLYIMKELGGGDLYIRVSGMLPENDPYAEQYSKLDNASPYLNSLYITKLGYYFIEPLLKQQPYIKSVNIYNGEEVTFNLDLYRFCYYNDECLDKIQGIRLKAFAETWGIKVSFVEPWITVNEVKNPDRKILVARSIIYQGGDMMYREIGEFLHNNAFFYGNDFEYTLFCAACDTLWRVRAADALDLANIVGGMEMVISNDNPVYWLALAMGVNEIHYEICPDLYNGINDNPKVSYFLGSSYVSPDVDFSKVLKKQPKRKNV